jgi:hypothetical protein
MWTLDAPPATIAYVRSIDAAYADWMERKYANFLP